MDGVHTLASASLTPQMRREIVEVFRLFDTGGVGFMDVNEVRVALRVMGMEVTKEDGLALALVYRTEDNRIAESDFVEIIADRIAERGQTGLRGELEVGFNLFDKDGYGTLTTRALQQVCREIGEPEMDLDKFFGQLVGSSSLSKEEFVELLSRRGF